MPQVSAAALPQLLIDLPTMQTLVGSPALEAGDVDAKLSELDAGSHFTPPECLSSMLWGDSSTFAGLNSTAAYGQTLQGPRPQGGPCRSQMVVLFPDAAAAAAAARRVSDQWRSCSGKQVTETRADGMQSPAWTIGEVVQTGR